MSYLVLTPSGLRSISNGGFDWATHYNYNLQRLNDYLLYLAHINDVDTTGLVDGDVLAWNTASARWKRRVVTPPPVDVYDHYVDPAGVNTALGGGRTNPWKTIQYAYNQSAAGDSICINAGSYNEKVTLALGKDGITFICPTRDAIMTTPEIIGREAGFYSDNTDDNITIDGLEFNGHRYGIACGHSSGWIVQNCRFHDMARYGTALPWSSQATRGLWYRSCTSCSALNNVFYKIYGPEDSYGILTDYSSGMLVRYNQFYLIGDAGVRDIRSGLVRNLLQDNWGWCCHVVAECDGDASLVDSTTWPARTRIYNNWAYFTRMGVSVKRYRTNDTTYCQMEHNTVRDSAFAGLLVGNNNPQSDYVSATYNFIEHAGYTAVQRRKTGPGNVTIDYNMYKRETLDGLPQYFLNDTDAGLKLTTLAQIQAQTAFEDHGVEYAGSSTGYGCDLAAPTEPVYYPRPLSLYNTSSSFAANSPSKLLRWRHYESPWFTAAGVTSGWIDVALGGYRTIRYALFLQWSDNDTYGIKNVQIQVSDNGTSWSSSLCNVDLHDGASLQIIDLGSAISTYYARLLINGSQGGNYLRFNCFSLGILIGEA